MKKIYLFIASLIFSSIFYEQAIGLNLLLFTLLTTTILIIYKYESFKNRKTLLILTGYIITGVVIFFYKSNLTIIANLLSFITLVGSISEGKSSIYIKLINGLYTSIVSVFTNYFNKVDKEPTNTEKQKKTFLYWLKLLIPSFIIIATFVSLYRIGNPMFDKLIGNIDLSFINFQWILLTGLGYYLFNNIVSPIKIEPATEHDLTVGNILIKKDLKETSLEKLKNEHQLGSTLLVLLNSLILFYLVLDFIFLTKIHELNAIELSKQVHSGINSLIISIILAIIIILYFFRSNLNFYKKNRSLKHLTYLWLFLNFILSIITFLKNYQYLSSHGLTYKRIGVIIYLILVIIGLVIAFIKVYKLKNFLFIIRKNILIGYVLLIVTSTLNWDKIITFYNINYAKQTDLEYLVNLTNNNTFLLKYYSQKSTIVNNHYKNKIDEKHRNYIKKLKSNTWKELVFDNLKIE